MKSILITGSNGFVGRSLSERLKDKYNVFAIKRADLNLQNSKDVKRFVDEKNIDIIIHTANQGGSRATGYDIANNDITMINLKMFFNLEACGRKLITFGSGAQYNKQRDLIKVNESEIGNIMPDDAYGFAKVVQHKFVEQSANILYPIIFGLFGKNEDYRFKFISNAIVKNLFKLPIVINQNVLFDYLYIEDFFNIIEHIIEKDCNLKSFNITPTESIDLVAICEIINNISNYKSDIVIKNKGLNFQYTGDNSLMLGKLGGCKFMKYHESISHLYEHFSSVIKTIDYNEIATDEYIKYCKVK